MKKPAHEEHLNRCIDDLMVQQLKLMDNLTDLNREIKQLNAQNNELLAKLKEQQDLSERLR